MISENLSNRFRNAGFIAACMVVGLHLGIPMGIGSSGWFGIVFFEYAASWCVPFFFLSSGFFIAAHIGEDGWWRREISKRINTILIPFMIWSALYFLFVGVESYFADRIAKREPFETLQLLMRGSALSILGLDLTRAPFYVQLWFLRSLFIIIIISPTIVWLLRKLGLWCLVAMFLAYYFWGADEAKLGENIVWLRCTLSLKGVFYVALGMWFRQNCENIVHYNTKACRIIAIACGFLGVSLLICSVYFRAQYGALSMNLNVSCIIGLLLFPLFWIAIPKVKWPEFLTNQTFPIYLIHVFFVVLFDALISKNINSIGVVFCKYVFALVMSWAVAVFARKLFGQKMKFFFGGR